MVNPLTFSQHSTVSHPGRMGEGGLRMQGNLKKSYEHKPLISIVTVVLNDAKHLEQAVKSVLGQTYNNIEYLIIDGGSTDGTLDIIRKHEKAIDYWVSEPDNGIYDAMNKGVSLACGDLIALLNSDDWYETKTVEEIVKKYKSISSASASVIYCNYYVINDVVKLKTKGYSHMKHRFIMNIDHGSSFIGKDVYRKIGYYDTAYSLASDWDMYLRMILGGINFFGTDYFGHNFRATGRSLVYGRKSRKELYLIIKKYFKMHSKERIILLLKIWKDVFKAALIRHSYRVLGIHLTNRIRLLKNSLNKYYLKEYRL